VKGTGSAALGDAQTAARTAKAKISSGFRKLILRRQSKVSRALRSIAELKTVALYERATLTDELAPFQRRSIDEIRNSTLRLFTPAFSSLEESGARPDYWQAPEPDAPVLFW